MFFIGGVQPKRVVLEMSPVSCPQCGHADVVVQRIDQYLSLFFIPIFPVKRGIPFQFCRHCQRTVNDRFTSQTNHEFMKAKFCPRCQLSLNPAYSYCPFCGRLLRSL